MNNLHIRYITWGEIYNSCCFNAMSRPQRSRKVVTHYSDDNPSTFTIKKKGLSQTAQEPKKVYVTLPISAPSTGPGVSSLKKRKRVLIEQPSSSSSAQIPQDTVLTHGVTVQPIIPLPMPIQPSIQATYPPLRCQSPAPVGSPPSSDWLPVPCAYASRYCQAGTSDHAVVEFPSAPITAWKSYYDVKNNQTSSSTIVCGDGAGYLIVYQNAPNLQRPVAKYDTPASQREEERMMTSKRITSLTYPYSILDVAMDIASKRIVGRTRDQLMVIDMTTGKNLWAVDLTAPTAASAQSLTTTSSVSSSSNGSVGDHSSLDIRNGHLILVTAPDTVFVQDNNILPTNCDSECSLYLIRNSTSDTSPETPTPLPLDLKGIPLPGTAVSAVWKDDKFLYVVYEPNVLAIVNSETGHIKRKTKLSEFRNIQDTTMTVQHGYLMICNKGIQCFDPENLGLLCVYGETVALHGKTVVWKDCIVTTKVSYDDICFAKKQTWARFEDFLGQSETGETEMSVQKRLERLCVIGIPHPTKGPDELKSTLYVWKAGFLDPITTVSTPPGGLLGLSCISQRDGWRLMCATAEFGKVHTRTPSVKSDFAGNMYPVGYRVIDENIEYVEDEDETDVLVKMEEIKPKNDIEETIRLAREATKASLEYEDDVSVLAEDAEEEWIVPCRPEKGDEAFEEQPPDSPKRQRADSFPDFLGMFPQVPRVREELQINEENKLKDETSDLEKALHKGGKGKRYKMSNIEQLLVNSVDPILRQRMLRLQSEWSDGRGSTVLGSDLNSRLNETVRKAASAEDRELALELLLLSPQKGSFAEDDQAKRNGIFCSEVTNGAASLSVTPSDSSATPQGKRGKRRPDCGACAGRMVLHTCGKRDLPIDFEAIERREKEEREAQDAERERVKKEKRKAAEEKRKEARKRKKEEEERLRQEQLLEEEQRRAAEGAKLKSHEQNMQELEGGLSDDPRIQEPVETSLYRSHAVYTSSIPKYSELSAELGDRKPSPLPFALPETRHSNTFQESIPSAPGIPAVAPRNTFFRSESLPTQSSLGSETSGKSTSGLDSLLALAEIASESAQSSDMKTEGNDMGNGYSYGYSGSLDRRNQILSQYASTSSHLHDRDQNEFNSRIDVDSAKPPANGVGKTHY